MCSKRLNCTNFLKTIFNRSSRVSLLNWLIVTGCLLILWFNRNQNVEDDEEDQSEEEDSEDVSIESIEFEQAWMIELIH